jgi:hypothetical protein
MLTLSVPAMPKKAGAQHPIGILAVPAGSRRGGIVLSGKGRRRRGGGRPAGNGNGRGSVLVGGWVGCRNWGELAAVGDPLQEQVPGKHRDQRR